jgi:hypothetical protein
MKLNWKTTLLGLVILALQMGKPLVEERWRASLDQACLLAAGAIGVAARDHDNNAAPGGEK